MANIVNIEMVVIYGRKDVRYGPVNHLRIEIFNLLGNILRQVPGVLEKNGAHDDLQFFYGLLVNHISLRLAPVKYGLAYSVLEKFHVLCREESFTYGCLFPIPPEHVRLKVPFYGRIRLKPGNKKR